MARGSGPGSRSGALSGSGPGSESGSGSAWAAGAVRWSRRRGGGARLSRRLRDRGAPVFPGRADRDLRAEGHVHLAEAGEEGSFEGLACGVVREEERHETEDAEGADLELRGVASREDQPGEVTPAG